LPQRLASELLTESVLQEAVMKLAWLFCGLLMVDANPQRLPETQAIVEFQRAADDYAFTHRRIERRLPALDVTADVATLRQAIDSMAAAIRAARPAAGEGDLFTASVRPVLGARIVKAMRLNGLTVTDLDQEAADAPPARLQVNGDMPWRLTGAVPPCVLEVLPRLPPELQYRFVGADLLLVDVHASLIVDIMRDAALPRDTSR
jgi:hypothetical protein